MARYSNVLPMVDWKASSFAKVKAYLESKKFSYKVVDGESVFQKGDGIWVAPSFVKVTYAGGMIRLEAWINGMGAEMDLEGFVGYASKKPMKKIVQEVESILKTPGVGYAPENEEPAEISAEEPAHCTPLEAAMAAGENITKEMYFKRYASDSFYNNLKINSVIGYILCGILGLTCLVNPWNLIDLGIYLGLVLGMHLGKRKICAILLTIYTSFCVVFLLIMSGTLSGWAWLILSIYSWILFRNEEKRYRNLVSEKQQ